MLHFYFGEDDFRMREAYAALRASLDADGMLATNTTLLPARGLKPQELAQHAATVPFLAEARMVVVEGLIASLGGGQAVVREWQPLLDLIPQLPPTNHLVLLEPFTGHQQQARDQGRDLDRSALAKALRALDGVEVRAFPALGLYGRGGEESEVARWAAERARERGVEIEPRAVDQLVDLVGANLWTLAGEIDKLSRYADGRAVTADDVRLLTPEAREESIFGVVDAVVEGRGAPALLLLRKMLDEGSESPQRIQGMIARQLRHLVRATELLEDGAGQDAIAEATGLKRGSFPLRKLMGQARTARRSAVEGALRAVEASDHAVKTGRIDEVLALELLVTRLAALARAGATAAAARR